MMKEEITQKLWLIRQMMDTLNTDGLLISRRDNFAWVSAGKRNLVSKSTEIGFTDILVTRKEAYCVANNIEMPRILQEELTDLFEPLAYNWWEGDKYTCIKRTLPELKIIKADTVDEQVQAAFRTLRHTLCPQEQERYKQVGLQTAQALEMVCRRLKMGMTENEAAAFISCEALKRGIESEVVLVAFDDRAMLYRHPISTDKQLERYAILVVCGQKYGLVANVTRLVCLGSVPDDLRNKYKKLLFIEAEIIAMTKSGVSIADIFTMIQRLYSEVGYPEEWKLHHQGGAAGYAGREYLALPDSTEMVHDSQAFAWNPTISGVKVEDTFIVQGNEQKLITQTDSFPQVEVSLKDSKTILRPDILVL